MVSNASDDLPEPDRPVITTSLSRGISTSMFLRLCSRAPLMTIFFIWVGAGRRYPRWRRLLSSRVASPDRISSAFTLTPEAQLFLAAPARDLTSPSIHGSAARRQQPDVPDVPQASSRNVR